MSKLRSLLVWLIFVPFTFVWFIPVLISALWPPRKRHRMGAMECNISLFIEQNCGAALSCERLRAY